MDTTQNTFSSFRDWKDQLPTQAASSFAQARLRRVVKDVRIFWTSFVFETEYIYSTWLHSTTTKFVLNCCIGCAGAPILVVADDTGYSSQYTDIVVGIVSFANYSSLDDSGTACTRIVEVRGWIHGIISPEVLLPVMRHLESILCIFSFRLHNSQHWSFVKI